MTRRNLHLASTLFALIFASAFTFGTTASALDITACGQTVPRGDIGVLQVDLVCSDEITLIAVSLEPNAALDLNGHTISGGGAGVGCFGPARSCTVRGPGVISGATANGIAANNAVGRIIVEDVTISDNQYSAVFVPGGRAISLKNVVIARNNLGFDGSPEQRAHLGAVQWVRRLDVENVIAIDNVALAFATRNVYGDNVTLIGNYGGFRGMNVRLGNATIADNIGLAMTSTRGRVRFVDSTLANNDTAGAGVDMLTARKPSLVNTSCGRSQLCRKSTLSAMGCTPELATWQVCANDF